MDGVYAELGRISSQKHLHINILKFSNRLANLLLERYTSQAFHMLLNDEDSRKSNWLLKSRDFKKVYDIRNSDNHSVLKHEKNNTLELKY